MAIDPLVYEYVANEENYPENAVIIEEGSNAYWVYVVLEGQVKVKKRTPNGMVTVNTLKEGAIFGEIAFFQEGKVTRTASVIADGPVQVGILDTERLITDWQMLSPQLKGLIMSLIKRLQEATKRTIAMVVEST
ncbi:MAG: cyclic nucleotide-binding domain-containing protein [Deltaproteobacteria bacterium]|nr:cyclic nucleotide-binding domain-containing protein [Deltaproteobacteria bacterium]MBW2018754.1 cyclic nucleotide-binding domain-containing protein [Deltaproteobacteria bacterium]MBW2073483.1 cyclic nucleotide-binding domain-containing protein [Deltaproteobacteria bacterium]